MVVAFKVPAGTPAETIEVQARPTGVSAPWGLASSSSGMGFVVVDNVERGVQCDVQIRARRGTKHSPWSDTTTHTVSNVVSQIGTENIERGALRQRYSGTWSGSLNLSGSWTDVVPLTVTVADAADEVFGSWRASYDVTAGSGDTLNVQARIVDRTGAVVMPARSVTVNTTTSSGSNYSAEQPATTEELINNGAGSGTWKLQMINSGTAAVTVTDADFAIEDRLV